MVTTIRGKTRRNRRAIAGRALVALAAAVLPAICIPRIASVHAETAATTQPSKEISNWVNQLADGDTLIREKARDNLMALQSQELPALQSAVAGVSDRLLPSQKIYLREIVRQVFLSGLSYPTGDEPLPFIGVRWNNMESPMSFDIDDRSDAPTPTTGLLLDLRVPGFDAYRMLRDGDLVVGIVGVLDKPGFTSNDFSDVIRAQFRPGDIATLRVVRSGHLINVKIKLGARPMDLPPTDIASWTEPRDEAAEEYWKQYFQPIVKDDGPMLSWGAW